jgi:hypothetical protein
MFSRSHTGLGQMDTVVPRGQFTTPWNPAAALATFRPAANAVNEAAAATKAAQQQQLLAATASTLPPPPNFLKLALYGGAALGGAYLLYRLLRGSSSHEGAEVHTNPARRRNPSRVPVLTRSERLKRAVATYEGFHWGDPPDRIVKRKVSKAPKVAVKLGKLVAVAYETHKNGEHAVWEHEFGEEGGKRPDLVMDADTEKLHIVGGSYTVTDAGIID